MTKGDGTAIPGVTDNSTDASGVGPANMFLQALFSYIDVTLQNKAVMTCDQNP